MSGGRGRTTDIVCMSTNHWTGLPTSKQHLTWVLSRTRRVLYVDPPIDVFSALGRKRRWPKFRGLRSVRDGVWVLSPVVLDNRSDPRARLRFHRRSRGRVRAACRRLGLESPVLWTFTPEHGPYAGALGESLTVYHVADDLPAMSGDPAATAELEARHIERADLIFVVSQALYDRMEGTGKAHRLPNAADAGHYMRVITGSEDATAEEFASAVRRPRVVPPEFARARRPIMLYGGATYQWFDDALFLELAAARPDWTFATVGPTKGRLARGGLPDNVLVVGRRGYDDFPWYVASADAAVMPWHDDAITKNADPIGLYEYLLCGKPVVASPFPAALERGELLRTATTAAEFESALEDALAEDPSGELAARRTAFGLENTWERRAARALELIARSIAEKRGESGTGAGPGGGEHEPEGGPR